MASEEPPELDVLQAAIAGLLYPSESDEPFEVFCWDDQSTAAEQVAAHADGEIVKSSAEEFFAPLTKGPDAERFAALRGTLGAQLTDLEVFRVGQIEINIYLVGKTKSGVWAGLRTLSVET